MELLWSDPAIGKDGFSRNLVRDPKRENRMVLFGEDVLNKFLSLNQLSFMVRANQICQNGVDIQANGKCITVSSCTDFYGAKNSAAILILQKDFLITPKIIKPIAQGNQWL